eukprot:Hpha_TRINITY_DN12267_c0_g1::TRINITY_DN12267_c0_g1_i2::g.17025::m.17025
MQGNFGHGLSHPGHGDAGGVAQNHYLHRHTQNCMDPAPPQGRAAKAMGLAPTKPGPQRKEATVEAARHRDKEILRCIEAWEALQPPGFKGVSQKELPSLLLHVTGSSNPADLRRVRNEARHLLEEEHAAEHNPQEEEGDAEAEVVVVDCSPPTHAVHSVTFTDARTGSLLMFTPDESPKALRLAIKGARVRDPITKIHYEGGGKLVLGSFVCVVPTTSMGATLGQLAGLAQACEVPHDIPTTTEVGDGGTVIPREDLPRVLGEVFQSYHPEAIVLPRTVKAVDDALDAEGHSRLTREQVQEIMTQLNEGKRPVDHEIHEVLEKTRRGGGKVEASSGPPGMECVIVTRRGGEIEERAGDYLLGPDLVRDMPAWIMQRRRYAYYAGVEAECAQRPSREVITRRVLDSLGLKYTSVPHPTGATFIVSAATEGHALRQGTRVVAVCGKPLREAADLQGVMEEIDKQGLWELPVVAFTAASSGRRRWALRGEEVHAMSTRPPSGQHKQDDPWPTQSVSLKVRQAGGESVSFAALTNGLEIPLVLQENGSLRVVKGAEPSRFLRHRSRFGPGFDSFESCTKSGWFIAAPVEQPHGPLSLMEVPESEHDAFFRAAVCYVMSDEEWRVTEDYRDIERVDRRAGLPLPCAPHEMEDATFLPLKDEGGEESEVTVNKEPVWVEYITTILSVTQDGKSWEVRGKGSAEPVLTSIPHGGRLPHVLPAGSWRVGEKGGIANARVSLPDPRLAEALFEKDKLREPLQRWYVGQAGEDHSSNHCLLDGPGDGCTVL